MKPVHCRFDADELAYLRARAAAEERSVPWVVRRLVREAMERSVFKPNPFFVDVPGTGNGV